MRFFFVLLLTGLLSSVALILMPWWIPMLLSFLLILLLPLSKKNSFLSPALGCAIAFMIIVLVKDFENDHLLSSKIAQIFHVPSYFFLILITGLVGFITAGLGGLTARLFIEFSRSLLHTEQEDEFVSVDEKEEK